MVFASPSGQFYRDVTTSCHLPGLISNRLLPRRDTLRPPTGTGKKLANPDTVGNSTIPPSRYQKCAGLWGHSASRPTSNIVYRDKTLFHRLSIYTATRKMPAEYFCPRTYKKLALAPRPVNKLTLPRQFTFSIKLVPRDTSWPIFYACPRALQMVFGKQITSWLLIICKGALLLTVFYCN